MQADEPKVKEAFALLDTLQKAFNQLSEDKKKPCIGTCNTDCGGLEPTHRRTTNFYSNNVA